MELGHPEKGKGGLEIFQSINIFKINGYVLNKLTNKYVCGQLVTALVKA